MDKLSALAAALLAAPALAQEVPPVTGPGPWTVLVVDVVLIEPTQKISMTQPALPNQWQKTFEPGDIKVTKVVFDRGEDCTAARNTALLSQGLTLPLGTGSAGLAHLGRTVSLCFRGQ